MGLLEILQLIACVIVARSLIWGVRIYLDYHGVQSEFCTVLVQDIDLITEYFWGGERVPRYAFRCTLKVPDYGAVQKTGYQPWHVIAGMHTGQVFSVVFRRGRHSGKLRIIAIKCA